jgi:hypothetical protein
MTPVRRETEHLGLLTWLRAESAARGRDGDRDQSHKLKRWARWVQRQLNARTR